MGEATLRTVLLAAGLALAGVATARAADTATIRQPADQWRASKLMGVPVYGSANKVVGRITDVMMSHDGRAEAVVIGVGGFLGLGQKDVAIPFAQVRFVDEPVQGAAAAASPADAGTMGSAPATAGPATASTPAGVPNAAALGTVADTLGTPTVPAMAGATGTAPAPAGTVPRSGSEPDHGVVDMTADQLRSAPAFHFAP